MNNARSAPMMMEQDDEDRMVRLLRLAGPRPPCLTRGRRGCARRCISTGRLTAGGERFAGVPWPGLLSLATAAPGFPDRPRDPHGSGGDADRRSGGGGRTD